jgi:hypothetical protein
VRLWNLDRVLLVCLCRLYPSLQHAIIIVRRRPCSAATDAVSAPTDAGSPATSAAVQGLIAIFER